MSLWKRFIRALKALFGGAVAAMEDPKLIIEQNIRELNDQVPKLNSDIANVKANVTLLQKQLAADQSRFRDLDAKVRAALAQQRDDIAGQLVGQLQTLKTNIAKTQEQLAMAEKAYEKVLEIKKAFMRERERKIAEAREALQAHERSKMQARIADTLEQFEVTGIDSTHDEMINRINEQTARNEARVEMALDSVDTSGMKIEEEAQKIRANDLLAQYKAEMGLGTTTSTDINVQGSGGTTGSLDSTQNRNSVL
jgi:phage shock protein A